MVTNTYTAPPTDETGVLSIVKLVESDEEIEIDRLFMIHIELKDDIGTPLSGTFGGVDFNNGKGHILLGNLSISNQVTGAARDTDQTFTFVLTLTDGFNRSTDGWSITLRPSVR